MKRIARFYKVSRERFEKDLLEALGEGWKAEGKTLEAIYEGIKLPQRATSGSAGYDFFLPVPLSLKPGEAVKIPTGIRAQMGEEWVLQIYPRSGLGFKYRLQMNNTVGIIDSDYFFSDNEGHILIKVFNDGREGKIVELPAGAAFAQGIFLEYGITEDDNISNSRNGGFGSTDAGR